MWVIAPKKSIIPTVISCLVLFVLSALIISPARRYGEMKDYAESAKTQIQTKDAKIKNLETIITKYEKFALKRSFALGFYHNGREKSAGWRLHNNGEGPGTVKWFSVSVDNIEQPHWNAFLQAMGLPEVDYKYSIPWKSHDILRGRGSALFWIEKQGKAFEILQRNYTRAKFSICYCSIYKECWITTDRLDQQNQPSSCKSEPKIAFQSPPRK